MATTAEITARVKAATAARQAAAQRAQAETAAYQARPAPKPVSRRVPSRARPGPAPPLVPPKRPTLFYFYRDPRGALIKTTTRQPGKEEISPAEYEAGRAAQREEAARRIKRRVPRGIPMPPIPPRVPKEAPKPKEFIYTVELEPGIATAEQVRRIRRLAEKRGVEARIISPPTGKVIIELKSPEEILEKEFLIPSAAEVRQRRIERGAKIVAEKAYAEATPAERERLALRTLLSPRGYEFIGAHVVGKPPEKIVKEKLAEEIKYSIMQPKVDVAQTALRGVVEYLQSPVFEAEVAFAGVAGIAKIAATRVGAKILTTKIAKAGMVGLGAYYVGGRAVEAKILADAGRIEEAVGKIIVTGAAIGAGIAGYKLQTRYIMRAPAEITVDVTKVKGVSATVRRGKVTYETRGKFIVEEPEPIKGLEGIVQAVGKRTGKVTRFRTTAYVPRQKVGPIDIKTTVTTRYGKAMEVPGMKGRLQIAKTRDILGYKTGEALGIETARLKTPSYIVRQVKTVGLEVTPKEFRLQAMKEGMLAARTTVKKGISRLDIELGEWVDVYRPGISKIVIKEPSIVIGRGPAVSAGRVPSVSVGEGPTVSVGKVPSVSVGKGPAVGVKPQVVPKPLPSPPVIRAKIVGPLSALAKLKPTLAPGLSPKAIAGLVPIIALAVPKVSLKAEPRQVERERARIVSVPIPRTIIVRPRLKRQLKQDIIEKAILVSPKVIPVQDIITETVQKQRVRLAMAQVTETVMKEPPIQPVPVHVVPRIPPPPTVPGLIIPGLYVRLPPSLLKKRKYGLRWLIHPIPSIEVLLGGKNGKKRR